MQRMPNRINSNRATRLPPPPPPARVRPDRGASGQTAPGACGGGQRLLQPRQRCLPPLPGAGPAGGSPPGRCCSPDPSAGRRVGEGGVWFACCHTVRGRSGALPTTPPLAPNVQGHAACGLVRTATPVDQDMRLACGVTLWAASPSSTMPGPARRDTCCMALILQEVWGDAPAGRKWCWNVLHAVCAVVWGKGGQRGATGPAACTQTSARPGRCMPPC